MPRLDLRLVRKQHRGGRGERGRTNAGCEADEASQVVLDEFTHGEGGGFVEEMRAQWFWDGRFLCAKWESGLVL